MPRKAREFSYIAPPAADLARLQSLAGSDLATARIVLGLFDSILGSCDRGLLPDYTPALSDIEVLPARTRCSAKAVFAWGTKRGIILNELLRARHSVAEAVVRMRRDSPYGRRRIRIANELREKYPPLKPDNRSRPRNPQTLEVLGDEIGHALGHGTILRLLALAPSQIEIRRHREPLYASWADRAAYIQLQPDGYSIQQITMVVSVEPIASAGVVTGVLEDFFETGTEGVIWSVYDDDNRGYDGLHTIEEGDHLTICDQLGHRIWAGIIRCDRKAGWKRYPLNPKYGQPCALGHWVHWTQKGFKPDVWARFFIRPQRDRLRAILRKKAKVTEGIRS